MTGLYQSHKVISTLFSSVLPHLQPSATVLLLADRPVMGMIMYFERRVKKARLAMEFGEGRTPQFQTTLLERLPREIIMDILTRLPVTSLVQFRFVCWGWRKLAEDPLIATMHLSGTAQQNPCLILHTGDPIRNQLSFLDISSSEDREKTRVRKLITPFWNSMPDFEVVGSFNGILCLEDTLYKDNIYVYNPFTGDYKLLPGSVQYQDQDVTLGFGFHPVTELYKVVRIVYYRNGNGQSTRSPRFTCSRSEVQVLTLGSRAWRSLGKAAYHLENSSSEALVSGRLHWVSRPKRYLNRVIVSFDVGDEQFREVPKPDGGGLSRTSYHLQVLNGFLSASVYRSNGKLEIWVMKEYDVKESWVKAYTIGAHFPKGLRNNGVDGMNKMMGNSLRGRGVRILCELKNGELLLEYRGRALFSYNPDKRKFKDITLEGSPKWFKTSLHVGSLNWIESFTDN